MGKLVHDRFTPLARLVEVTLRGVWVARPVGADRIGHAADGFVGRRSGPVAPRALWENAGPEKYQKRPQWGGEGGGLLAIPPRI